jgi:hypothetical protein
MGALVRARIISRQPRYMTPDSSGALHGWAVDDLTLKYLAGDTLVTMNSL